MRRTVLQRGYCLVEVLMMAAIIGSSLAITLPALESFIKRANLNSGVDALKSSLLLARGEAVRRNSRVVVCKSSTGYACMPQAAWEHGWIVFHDANGNSKVDPGEEVIYRGSSLDSRLRFRGNSSVDDYIAYTGLGRTTLSNGAFQAGTITVCHASLGPAKAQQLVINNVGRVRVASVSVERCA
jgi:type IV fimbrial biogenesis protein FimT